MLFQLSLKCFEKYAIYLRATLAMYKKKSAHEHVYTRRSQKVVYSHRNSCHYYAYLNMVNKFMPDQR